MSLRSQRSARSTGSATQQYRPLTDADVYGYALRVAVLQHVINSKPAPSAASSTSTVKPDGGSSKRESLRRTATESLGNVSGSSLSNWSSLSLGDLFRSDSKTSSGTVKYPERFVKVLEHKIENISRGTDNAYTDMLLRYTIGAFYGKYKDPKNVRLIKENRKLEDLLMMFIATATEILRKRCTGDEWKMRLEEQVESFVKILEECLRSKDVKHVPPELLTKVETLKTKLSANRPPPISIRDSFDGGASLPATPDRQSMDVTHSIQAWPSNTTTYSVADIPAVCQIGVMFGVDMSQLQKDVNAVKKMCTEKAALTDLKQCVNSISSNAPFPGCREDFPSEEAYREWRTAELASLQQAMLAMIQHSPELVQASEDSSPNTAASSSRPTSIVTEAGEAYIGSRLSRQSLPIAEQFSTSLSLTPTTSTTSSNSAEDFNGTITPSTDISIPADSSSSLTYIPHDVKGAYRRLLEIMLTYDLGEMANLDPSEEVPLRILSRANQDLLAQCCLRWRVTRTFRFVAFFEEMSRRYGAGEMPVVECVVEALSDYEPLQREWANQDWPIADRKAFLYTVSQLFDALLRSFYETYSEEHDSESIPPIVETLIFLRDNQLFDEAIPAEDLAERFEQLKEGIRRVSDFLYGRERDAILHQQPPEAIVPMLDLLNWIKQMTKGVDKKYKSPLLGVVDVPQLFLERVPDIFLQDLSDKLHVLAAMQKPKQLYTTPNDSMEEEKPPLTDGEGNALYTGVKELTEMHDAFCPNTPLQISVNQQFEPYISRWISETDKKTLGWVRSAINLDEFKPDDEDSEGDKHSSSIVDLIASCKGAVQFVTDLGWPDEYQNAVFLTKLSATVSKSIEQYCIAIEELFMREMIPAKRDIGSERDERTSAWLIRAKALYQEKKLEAFLFKPTSCVKLNNIHAARELLDKMYTAIDADKVASLTRERGPPLPPKSQLARNLFTVKLVLGEGLANADGVSRVDPFVTLSDERGLRIAKTRTLYETTEPRWAETFDISVEGKMWIAATVWNRNLVDEHELVGRTYLALDPQVYSDFLPHDMWQDLDTIGRLLLRISMEGEKDDIQFYFGRAFRSLKRAENDMTRIIVDKISPFVRAAVSRSSLKGLLKKGGFSYLTNLNLEKAFDKTTLENRFEGVKNLMRSRDPNAPEIPLPPSLSQSINKALPSPTTDKKRAPGLTDAEIEEPLGPLLDYLDQCLETFRKYLSESAWQTVMTKIWKEVLSIVESLLVPALSDQPTDMKALSDKEVDIVFKWLKFLTDFFYADGGGVPIEDLRNPRYRAVMMIRLYYDWSTDQLMEECVRLTNQQLTAPTNNKGVTRSKSVYQQRNLGTIKEHKKEKNEDADSGAAEMVMRILRLRPGALDFLQQQMGTLNMVQERQHKPTRLLGSIRGRGKGRANRGRGGGIPGSNASRLPPIPSPSLDQQHMRQYR